MDKRIGAQLYTVREHCTTLEDFALTLRKVADIGYRTVQISGTCAFDPVWLGEELKKYENRKIVVGDGAKLCYNTLTNEGILLELAPAYLRMQSAWGVARAAEELADTDWIKEFMEKERSRYLPAVV